MIILDAILLIIILLILTLTCGIRAGIQKIKTEFKLYKFYIVRGAIVASAINIILVAVGQILRQDSWINKIVFTLVMILIAALPAIFNGITIGGLIGYLFGKIFGKSGRHDSISEGFIEKLRRWVSK